MGDRGDPQDPWQDYGGDGWDPRVPPPEPPAYGQSYLPVPRYRPEPPVPAERWSDDYSDYSDYSDEWDEDYAGDGAAAGPLRRAAGEVAWRYRSAPLWLRATLDVSAVALVMTFVVGAALTLRGGGPTDEVGAFVAPAPTTVSTGPTSAPVPLGGSTTTSSTTTTVPTTTTVRPTTTAPTTTTVPTTTTSTRPPRGNGPPTTGPTTTTAPPAPEPHYDNCFQAWRAGALPLHRGDPGYGPHLDDDNDGTACEPGEGF